MDSALTPIAAAFTDAPLTPESRAALEELARRYPYFTAPTLALLRHDPEGTEADEWRTALAGMVSSSRTLAFAAHGAEWRDFYPPLPEAEAKRTDDVIDIFLNTYGSCTPEEEALLERMIFNPTPDYAEMLAREEQDNLPAAIEAGDDSQDARIAAFILSQHPATQRPESPVPPEPEESEPHTDTRPVARPEHSDDSLLSESLALIFIKPVSYTHLTLPTT